MRLASILPLLLVYIQCSYAQYNLIANPSFEPTEVNYLYDMFMGDGYHCGQSDYIEYWENCIFWQPPGDIGVCQHPGTADLSTNGFQRTGMSCASGGDAELIVGEVDPALVSGDLYYIKIYTRYNTDGVNQGPFSFEFSYNRPNQCTYDWITFNGESHQRVDPEIEQTSFGSDVYRRRYSTFVPNGSYDRITIGIQEFLDDAADGSAHYTYMDDIQLIRIGGPGGLCPEIREIQNITYLDEIISYKASETIVAGTDVATYTSLGSVTVTGTSDITYRAGHEIQLLDGFGVEAGGTFHAFIAPCECDDPIAEAGPSIEVCDVVQAGGTIQIGGTPMDSTTYVWSSYPEDGLAFISDPTAANPQFTPQAPGTYTFTVTATNVCQEVSTDDVTLAYILNADDTPNLDVDFNLSESTFLATLQITPDPSAYEIVVQDWISNGTVLGAEWLLTVSQDFESGQPFDFTMPALINGCDGHRVKVKLRNICSSEWVTVQEYFPQTQDPPVFTLTTDVISPNGDGINDQMCFAVSSGLAYDVLIFDRDGLLVYSASDQISSMPVCTWDGTCNETCTGEALTAGTYYQLILVMGCDENPVAFGGDIFLTNSPSGRMADPNLPIDEVRSEASRTNSQSALSALHPNPTSGLITYSATGPLASATIMDLTGHTLYSQPCNGSNSISIDLSPFRPGTYLLRLQYQSGRVEVHRIIRQ